MTTPKSDSNNQKYTEDAESLLSHSDMEDFEDRGLKKTKRWSPIQHTLLLIFTHFLVAGTAVWLWNHGKADLDRVCGSHTSNYCELLFQPNTLVLLTC